MDVAAFRAVHEADWRHLEGVLARRQREDLSPQDVSDILALGERVRGQLETAYALRDPTLIGYLKDLDRRAASLIGPVSSQQSGLPTWISQFSFSRAFRRTAPFVLIVIGLYVAAFLVGLAQGLSADPTERADTLNRSLRQRLVWAVQGVPFRFEPGPGAPAHYFFHNSRVAAFGFASGVVVVAPLLLAGSDGLWHGSHAGAFVAVGQGDVWWSVVGGHGFLETAAICVALGAGFRMGVVFLRAICRRKWASGEIVECALVAATAFPALGVAAFLEGMLTDLPSADLAVSFGAGLALVYLVAISVVPYFRSDPALIRSGNSSIAAGGHQHPDGASPASPRPVQRLVLGAAVIFLALLFFMALREESLSNPAAFARVALPMLGVLALAFLVRRLALARVRKILRTQLEKGFRLRTSDEPVSSLIESRRRELETFGFEALATGQDGDGSAHVLLLRRSDSVMGEVLQYATGPSAGFLVTELTSVLAGRRGVLATSNFGLVMDLWSAEVRQTFSDATPEQLLSQHERALRFLEVQGLPAQRLNSEEAIQARSWGLSMHVSAALAAPKRKLVRSLDRIVRRIPVAGGPLSEQSGIWERLEAIRESDLDTSALPSG